MKKIFAPEFKVFGKLMFRILIIIYAIVAGILYIPTLGWSIHLLSKLLKIFSKYNIDEYGMAHSFWGEYIGGAE